METPRQHNEASERYYNVKVLRNYVLYFEQRLGWSKEQIENLFRRCNVDSSYMESDDNWFDQTFADNFHEHCIELSRDPDIAFKVGHYAAALSARGIVGRLNSMFLSASIAYSQIGRIASHYNRGLKLSAIKVTRTTALLRAELINGCNERPYQCRNRIGMLESLPLIFDAAPYSTVHNTCIHHGAPYCEYLLSWKEPWNIRLYPIIGVLAALVLGVLLSVKVALVPALLSTLSSVLVSSSLCKSTGRKRMLESLQDQNEAVQDSLRIMDRRSREAELLGEVMALTTEVMGIQQLCKVTVRLIQSLMKYDRAIIMLCNREGTLLETKATVGFPDKVSNTLMDTSFRIREDNLDGHFVRVINTKKGILVRDLEDELNKLSPRSQALAKSIGTKSFVAVPLLLKGEPIGLIAVENSIRSNLLSERDLDLLQGLANHCAVAISNGLNFEALNHALTVSEDLQKKERRLKQLFESYVPSEMRLDLARDQTDTLKSERIELSVLFIDIVGFTGISERLSAQKVSEMLSYYIEHMHQIVEEYGGRINKIMGDGLLIYFRNSNPSPVDAAVGIVNSLPKLNELLKSVGYQEISIGLGIHKGVCILGNIGYPKRLDYTVVGDTVNVASRIQTLSRNYGENIILFSESLLTQDLVSNSVKRGNTEVKGREQPVTIYQWTGQKIQKNAA